MESMKRENYDLLEGIAKPILDDKAYYMQLSSAGMMDLNVEKVMDDIYAISHYGTLNGDAMADPDVGCRNQSRFDPSYNHSRCLPK